MALDVKGGIDYAVLKHTYSADDYVDFAFTATEDYYIVGLIAYNSDPAAADLEAGWGLYKHNQPASPLFLAATLGPTLPEEVPSFEAKFMRVYSDQDCWIRFDGPNRVQHFIPKTTWVEFNRRCNIIFVVRDTLNGTLGISFYG